MLNMKKNVKVREILGRECNIEDAILLRVYLIGVYKHLLNKFLIFQF